MKNQIPIIIGAVVISLCVGLAIPIAAAGNVEGLVVDQVQLKSNALNQFKEEMGRLVETDFDKRVSAEMETQIASGRDQMATQGGADKANQAGLPEGVDQIYADANSADRAKATVLTAMAGVGSDTAPAGVDPNLDENTVLAGYVDEDYLSGLAADGMTSQEDSDLQDYLQARFLPDDYELAKALNDDYAKLITE